jgi:hypothetical protein
MKAALFLLLALGAAFASACDNYQSCQCVGSNGSANDSATDVVCNSMNDGQIISTGNGNQCQGGEDLNNCDWDDFCALAQSVDLANSWCS